MFRPNCSRVLGVALRPVLECRAECASQIWRRCLASSTEAEVLSGDTSRSHWQEDDVRHAVVHARLQST